MAINNINVSGNVGRDCELRVTQNGKNIASFSIAVTQGYGEHAKTSWLNCKMFGGMAEGLTAYVKKGDQICVSGEYVSEEWEKDGVKRIQPTIIVNQIQLSKKNDSQQNNQPAKQNNTPQPKPSSDEPPMDFDDSIPF